MPNSNNEFLVAVAGSGKTETISKRIAGEESRKHTLFLTYTVRNQTEGAIRIARYAESGDPVSSMGWMAFLLNEIVRPYLPLVFPEVKLRGLALGPLPPNNMRRKGSSRYFTSNGDARSQLLPTLAAKIVNETEGKPIARIRNIYTSIYLDEVQDLCGNDFVILEEVLKGDTKVVLVGDPRQAVLRTSHQDRKNKDIIGSNLVALFRRLESKKLGRLVFLNETHRYIKSIAAFADTVFPPDRGFEPTVSLVTDSSDHMGVYLIRKTEVKNYASRYNATILRHSVRSGEFPGFEVANFGECKGMTRDHILILATDKIEDFLSGKSELKDESACGLYVAITRARFSVAIAVKDPEGVLSRAANNQARWRLEGVQIDIWQP